MAIEPHSDVADAIRFGWHVPVLYGRRFAIN